MKTLFVSDGNKGGVGKSVAAALAVNQRRYLGVDVLLIEGDSAVPDLAARFNGIVPFEAVNLNRAGDGESSIERLGNILEVAAGAGQDVVLNLPAGAKDTFTDLVDVVKDIVGALDFNLVVGFSVGPQRTSTAALVQGLESGLLSIAQPQNRAILFPMFLGDPSTFDWVKNSVRPGFIEAGGQETAIPTLKPDDLRDKIWALPGAFSDLVEDRDALTLTERALFKRWLSLANEAIGSIL